MMPHAVTAFTCLSAGSQLGGFLCFLHLLSAHPWRERALVVDPNNELPGADRKAAVALHSRVSCTTRHAFQALSARTCTACKNLRHVHFEALLAVNVLSMR